MSSDDEEIKKMSDTYGFTYHHRSHLNASDTASTKSMMKEIIDDLNIDDDETIVMLYLTYPQRTLKDILGGITFFNEMHCKSMLCREELDHSPYLMMFDEENYKGRQVINHDLCRRQDYKKCFRLCHFLCIFKAGEIKKLNNNLYNVNTYFMPRSTTSIDIDTGQDLERFLNVTKKD